MENELSASETIVHEPQLARASTGQRLANYIIDVIVFYLLMIVLGVAIAIISPDTIDALDTESSGFDLADRILSLLLYAVYMGIAEAIFNGRSVGKFITGTKAVNLDGSNISASTAFRRGFTRAVPFCAFSALGSPCDPWQDRWNDTMVIDVKKSAA
ncbi:MAG: RDD family protein [Bacteroidetes bacterium]|nr:RDD family protein [Bacteroidota bacterium]